MRKIRILLALIVFPGVILIAGCSAGIKKSYMTERGDHYFKDGHLDQAETEYISALRYDHDNAHAWSQLGIIYFDEGRYQHSAPYLYRAGQLDTNNLELHLKLGQIYLIMGRIADAQKEAATVLNADPHDPEAPILLAGAVSSSQTNSAHAQLVQLARTADSAPLETALGMLAARGHDLDAATKDFKQAIALDPDSAEAYAAYANLLWTQNDLKGAGAGFKKASDLAKPRAPQRLQYAEFELQTGRLDDARTALEQMTKETPDYAPAWLGLAQVALAEKKFDDCGSDLKHVLDQDNDSFDALLLKGQLDLAQGKTDNAIAELEKLSEKYPQAPRVRYELALAYFTGSRVEKAMNELGTAINQNPDFAEATFLLAEIEIKNNNADSAVALLRNFTKRRPELAQAKLLLADACRMQGDFNDALDIYRQLEKASPQNPQVPLLMGSAFVEQKDDADARAEFERAQQLEPGNPTPQEELAELDLSEKQYAAATQRANQLLQQNSALPDPHLLLAKIYLAQAQTNASETELTKAINLQPKDETPYLLLAQLQFNSGQHAATMDTLNAALKRDPSNISVLMLMAQVQTAANNEESAADTYEQMLKLDPDLVPALNNLACIYAENPDQVGRAYDLAQHAHKLKPADPSITDTVGWVFFKKGQFTAAEKTLEDSASQLPGSPEAQFHYGMACYMQEDEGSAHDAFQRAMQTGNSNFPDLSQCNECLRILAIDAKHASDQDRMGLEKRLSAQPADPVALTRLAAIYQAQGASAQATPYCTAALRANPQSATAMILLAQNDMGTDPAKALDLAKSAYQLKQEDPQAQQTLGWAAYQNHNYQWAYSLLQIASLTQPNDATAAYEFAQAAFSIGKLSEALTAMNSASQTGLSGAEAADAKDFITLAPLYQQPDQAVAAQSTVQGILASRPDYPPALLVQAVIDSQKGDLAGAESEYEKILARFSDFAPAQKDLAILYAENLNEPDKAYPLAVKAREMFPDDPDVAKALGLVVFEKGDYTRAADLLDAIRDSKSADAELFYCLGISEYHLRNFTASRTSLQRALSMNLAGTQASNARETLAQLK
ncbi:MAG TPA: tetratricopeptide repeat protein [Verrucomicrobiae bacterium]|jgi:tetratricopeptide (TPR) repeat protein